MMVTILIPAYNEAKRLPRTLRDIERLHQEKGCVHRVVIVDDGSYDATIERTQYFEGRLPIEFVILPKNVGKWAAINEGLKRVYGLVLLMDADGSASVWELTQCTWPKRGEAVFGSRFSRGAVVIGKSWLRGMVSRGYRTFVRIWYRYAGGKERIEDMQCPWKLFWKEDVQLPLLSERFAGDIEFACRLRAKVTNHPVYFMHQQGGSVKPQAVWQMAVETIRIAVAMRLLRERRVQ